MAARKKVTKKVSKAGQKSTTIRAKGSHAVAKTAKVKSASAKSASAKPTKAKTTTARSTSVSRAVKSAKTKAKTRAAARGAAAERVKSSVAAVKGKKPAVAKSSRSKARVATIKALAAKPAAAAKAVKGSEKVASRKVEAGTKKIETAKKVETEKKVDAAKKAPAAKPVESKPAVVNAAPRAIEPARTEILSEAPKEALDKRTSDGETKGAEPVLVRNTTAPAQTTAGTTSIAAKTDAARAPAPGNVVAPAAQPGAAKAAKAASPLKTSDRDSAGGEQKTMKTSAPKHGFKLNEFVVYPAHGVGQIVAMEEQEVAGFRLELFVINFVKDKMTLRVPTSKVTGVGMRKLSDADGVRRSLEILTGRARIKRTMWSRRAQEYEAKINSGDINAIAEVVRDLFRSEAQPEQSYSERQLYEAALDRMMREVAAVQKLSETEALKVIEVQLRKNQKRGQKPEAGEAEAGIEEAA
jgi:CarD family transcriptional regulator